MPVHHATKSIRRDEAGSRRHVFLGFKPHSPAHHSAIPAWTCDLTSLALRNDRNRNSSANGDEGVDTQTPAQPTEGRTRSFNLLQPEHTPLATAGPWGRASLAPGDARDDFEVLCLTSKQVQCGSLPAQVTVLTKAQRDMSRRQGLIDGEVGIIGQF